MPILSYGKIKSLRQTKGFNQAEIAAELGISRPTYVLIEQGEKEPTLSQLYTLARLLGVEAGELCTNLPSFGGSISDYDKFKDLVAACIAYGADGGSITKTKLALLVYLADFNWYYTKRQSMTGATYYNSHRGPVAGEYFRALDGLYEGEAIGIEPNGTTMVIRAIEQLPATHLNQQELSLVTDIGSKWRDQSTEAIVNFVHAQTPYKSVKPGDPVPYESILAQHKDLLY